MASDSNVALRTALLGALSTEFPATAVFEIRTGTSPGSANAATGTLLWSFTIASGWAAASGGSRALAGVPLTANCAATGTMGYFRLRNAADTVRVDGSISGPAVVIATNALTAANGNVLNFASTTGVVVGMLISGTGVVPGSTVLALTGTTVTMSLASTAGVASAASITFGGDITVNNPAVTSGQPFDLTGYTYSITN